MKPHRGPHLARASSGCKPVAGGIVAADPAPAFRIDRYEDAAPLWERWGIVTTPLVGIEGEPIRPGAGAKARVLSGPLYPERFTPHTARLAKARATRDLTPGIPHPATGLVLDGAGVAVVDIDDPLKRLAVEAITGPSPLTIQTRRGVHLFFWIGADVAAQCWHFDGVDVLASGHVQAPGSAFVEAGEVFVTSIEGRQWEAATVDAILEAAAYLTNRGRGLPGYRLPRLHAHTIAALRRALKPSRVKPSRSCSGRYVAGGPFGEGERNITLFGYGLTRAAFYPMTRGEHPPALLRELGAFNAVNMVPPLSPAEVRGVAKSVWRYRPGLTQSGMNGDRAAYHESPLIPLEAFDWIAEATPGRKSGPVRTAMAAIIGKLLSAHSRNPYAIFPICEGYMMEATGKSSDKTVRGYRARLWDAGIIMRASSERMGGPIRAESWTGGTARAWGKGVAASYEWTPEFRRLIQRHTLTRRFAKAGSDAERAAEVSAMIRQLVTPSRDPARRLSLAGQAARCRAARAKIHNARRFTLANEALAALGKARPIPKQLRITPGVWRAAELDPATYGVDPWGNPLPLEDAPPTPAAPAPSAEADGFTPLQDALARLALTVEQKAA